jgi:hypothetical protein
VQLNHLLPDIIVPEDFAQLLDMSMNQRFGIGDCGSGEKGAVGTTSFLMGFVVDRTECWSK